MCLICLYLGYQALCFFETGSASAIQIRVGDTMRTLGNPGGFGDNEECGFDNKLSAGQSHVYKCKTQLQGQIVSIQAVDPTSSGQLKICDVIIHGV